MNSMKILMIALLCSCMCVLHKSVNQKITTGQRFTDFEVEAVNSYLYGKFITNQQLTLSRKITVEKNAENVLFANYQFTSESIFYYQKILYHYTHTRQTFTSVNLATTMKILLALAGDIALNPGPIHNPCTSCKRAIARTHRSVTCDKCSSRWPIKCARVDPTLYTT
jgi:hypothetical protein